MDVALIEASPAAEPLLDRLNQLYAYDFSEFMGLDVGEDGRFSGGTPIASCWSHAWRHAFLIRAEGRIAGFTILDDQSRITGDPHVADVAEFFVMRRFRRQGVGRLAAFQAFSCSPRWEVRQTAANVTATAFWRRTIDAFTGGAFTEVVIDDERWRGPVQRFDRPATQG